MTGLRCAVGGACAGPVEGHHATGRPGRGQPYFDAGLVIPLCVGHHHIAHRGWRSAGWDGAGDVALRLYRARFAAGALREGLALDAIPTSSWRAFLDLFGVAADLAIAALEVRS